MPERTATWATIAAIEELGAEAIGERLADGHAGRAELARDRDDRHVRRLVPRPVIVLRRAAVRRLVTAPLRGHRRHRVDQLAHGSGRLVEGCPLVVGQLDLDDLR